MVGEGGLRCCRRSDGHLSWTASNSLKPGQDVRIKYLKLAHTLELALAERRGVASDDNKLGLAGAKSLQG